MREFEDDEDAKLIGVYSTEVAVRDAITRVGTQPGFCENPEVFQFTPYELDKDHWTEGFVTVMTNAPNQ
jgi:hypothetical protein